MKKLFTILSILICGNIYATNFYVSNSGNDSWSGRRSDSAWATIGKVNASMASIVAGDSILFKRGDSFYGGLIITKSGSMKFPIIIGAYGTGAKPILSGLTTLTTWTVVSGNVWQCTPPVTLKANCNVLTVAGTAFAVGRTPNASYYVYDSATTTTLTSSAFGATNYIGAEVVVKKNSYQAEKGRITGQSGNVITFTSTQPIDNNNVLPASNGTKKFGFFFQRAANTLDQQNEWYYNSGSGKMQIYSTVNPNAYSIKASAIDTLITLGNRNFITVTDLTLEGAGMYAVESYDGQYITIRNCTFFNNTLGAYSWNTFNTVIDSCYMDRSFNGGIRVVARQDKQITVTNNTVLNTGQFIGMGLYWSDYNLKGITVETDTTTANNFVTVSGNVVRNSGHAGIQFQGANASISRNVVDSFCNQLDDNGAIYTFVNNQSVNNKIYNNRRVDSNFILHSNGAPDGANGIIDVAGYYMDDQSLNVTGKYNTIGYVAGNGVQLNNPVNMSFLNNTIFRCGLSSSEGALIAVNKKTFSNISNVLIKYNILYHTNNTFINFFHVNTGLNLPSPGITITQSLTNLWSMDSNYITNLKAAGYSYYYYATAGGSPTFPPALSYATWQGTYFHDQHSTLPPVTVTATNTNMYVNESDTILQISFTGLRKRDPLGNTYDNSANIQRRGSLILIDNGNSPVTNIAPTANAGADQSITLPTSSTSLSGSGSTDPDGTIVSYAWSKISGPTGGTLGTPNSVSTTVTSLQQGTYVYQLVVTDNLGLTGTDFVQIVVNPANVNPIANAGVDQTITLPTSTATLSGSGTDPDGTIASYHWTKLSGPAGGTITSPNTASSGVTALQAGTYVFQLTVTDNQGATGTDVMQIVVNPANIAPTANAGADQTITLPTTTVTLTGSGTDPDGSIVAYLWTKISGPLGDSINNPTSATTIVSGLTQGTFVYKLTVTDNSGATGSALVQIIVNAANVAPTADAGADQSITLPTSSTSLTGTGTDPDGTIVSYAWTKISGPTGGTLSSPNSATTGVSALQQGTYTYRLVVTDNNGLTGTDFMQIVVNPAIPPINVPPTANAGADQSTTLPNNTATLTGSGNDPDGSIVAYLWTKISGPTGGTITTPTTATTGVTALIAGVYIYQLRVTDNSGDTATDAMQLTVTAANIRPTANAGPDQTITLPVSSVVLTGTGTDPDGSIVAYHWTKNSGPTGGTIATANNASTNVTALQQGTYIFQLRVTDNSGDTAVSAVQIIVNAANQRPTADAGTNQFITLPVSTTTLTGSGTDPDGTIVGYLWRKLSGPTGGTITSNTNATTGITALQAGTYVYQLRVTDNSGDTATATVQVTVNPANLLPTANAGADQTITLPTNSTTLSGSGTDPDGTITAYLWRKLSGPTGGTISSPTNATTGITSLIEGTYIYQLRVTDNAGDTATDAIQITVNPEPVFNTPPVPNAGLDQSITLPTFTATLTGSAVVTTQGATIVSYVWDDVVGNPTTGTIQSPNSATTLLSPLVQGVYNFRLTVTDSNGMSATDVVQVTVNPVPPPNVPVLLKWH